MTVNEEFGSHIAQKQLDKYEMGNKVKLKQNLPKLLKEMIH